MSKEKENYKWELDWVENFDGEVIDTMIWGKIPRGKYPWNNKMSDNDNCYDLKDGKLILRGLINTRLDLDSSRYITGGVRTKGKKAFGPGRIEVRAKLNAASGAWPAIWLWPYEAEKGWPWDGEIDIVERLNHNDFVFQTLHDHYINILKQHNPKRIVKATFNPEEYNTFGVDILEDKLIFHVNGVPTLSYPKIDSLSEKGQYPFYREWFLLIDMQLGGDWVGKIEERELPVEMEIDWVRHYRKL